MVSQRDGWICDSCDRVIEQPKDGWVQWIDFKGPDERVHGRSLRLVHHLSVSPLRESQDHGCYADKDAECGKDGGFLADMFLEYFRGPDGLMRLLSMISEERLPKEEVLEMIKRLHIPGYECARPYFREAIDEGVFEPNNELPGYYTQRNIESVLSWLASSRP